MDRVELQKALRTLDMSIFFILVVIASVLLSLLSLHKQRDQVRFALDGGDPSSLPSVFPIRLGGSALILGALGFFFCSSLARRRQAVRGNDTVEDRSSWLNLTASALVLVAALMRLDDLLFVEHSNQRALLDSQDLPA